MGRKLQLRWMGRIISLEIANVEGIPLVSVQYWEWDEVRRDHNMKHTYLRSLLGIGEPNEVWQLSEGKGIVSSYEIDNA